MRTLVTQGLISVSLFGVSALLTACGSGNEVATASAPAITTSAAPTATFAAPQTEASHSGALRSEAPVGSGKSSSLGTSTGGEKVDCGKVDAPNGQVGLVAELMPAGTVGCTEAINVISEYFAQAPTKSEGTAHALTIDGWSCLADTGTQGTGQIGCDKAGRAFHTQP
jgi:hypothetical protein